MNEHAAAPGDQPPPIPNNGPSAHEHAVTAMRRHGGLGEYGPKVSLDLLERAEVGLLRYGTKLQPHNGRDALWDGYQEALDGIAYAAQWHLESIGTIREIAAHQLLAASWTIASRWAYWLAERPA